MHSIQQKIFDLVRTTNISTLKLRELGELVGEPHPQKIKHHLNQLLKRGFLKQNLDKTVITPVTTTTDNDMFISLPIIGSANCGEAVIIAEEHYLGYLQVSKSVVPYYRPNDFFIVKAAGHSMNKAKINGKSLEDGDYAVIDSKPKSYENKYVLSVINGMANIKKLIMNSENEQIVLVSESSQDYPPIYIHKDDFGNGDYLINGEVVAVIKKPSVVDDDA